MLGLVLGCLLCVEKGGIAPNFDQAFLACCSQFICNLVDTVCVREMSKIIDTLRKSHFSLLCLYDKKCKQNQTVLIKVLRVKGSAADAYANWLESRYTSLLNMFWININ